MMMRESSAVGAELEVRPCGMLVQKRNPNSEPKSAPAPAIRVRVKFGSVTHEIYVSSQATFGELKKLLSGPTGLHPLDQKVLFKEKERDSKEFLDIVGVKDRSKLVVLEDLKAQAKRCLEMMRAKKSEQASKSIARIGVEVDKLASKVSALEATVAKGEKVEESDLFSLTELLMNELLKLDAITADGDVRLQRRMQVRRVQKHVETLDMLKIKNSKLGNGNVEEKKKKKQSLVTTKWETFDSLSSASSSNPTTRVGIEHPTVEVRFEKSSVEADAYMGSRVLPTLLSATLNTIEGMLRLTTSKKSTVKMLSSVRGIVRPSRSKQRTC